MADFYTNTYNPDVLSCLANLSNDEVFTPPAVVNRMLDMLPQELFKDPTATFLDPATKSGVFLREIAKRLLEGLECEIPDLQERIDHIFHNQLYGIAITEMTSLLSRRSVYCSKYPNGKYSITTFDNPEGNVRFKRIKHVWRNGKCAFCGASQSEYDRDEALEHHAYELIHATKPEEIFNMKFDVIIGNPPYQLSDGGGGAGRSAAPIYQYFVSKAKQLRPRYLTMIIPSRWFAGGKGLDEFRSTMLSDKRIRRIVDYENGTEVFNGVDLAGGICYFLWNRDHEGECEVTNVINGVSAISTRALDEFPVFVRNSNAVPILRKVAARSEATMDTQVSSRKPFGLESSVRPESKGELLLRWQNGSGCYPKSKVTAGLSIIDKYKVIASKTAYDHAGNPGKDGKRKIFTTIEILPPSGICTETFLVTGAYDTEVEAENLVAYMKTQFFRFLVSHYVFSHNLSKGSYSFVPILDMKEKWTDEKLYARYNITEDEILFIDSVIRPMDLTGGDDE